MNQNDPKTIFSPGPIAARSLIAARGLIAAAVYYLLNILLFPITLVGYVLMSVSFYAGRKSDVSGTALAPLTGRWLLHNLGTRPDEPASRLMMAMAGLPVSLTLGPMIIAHRVSGYVPEAYRYPFQGEITLGNQGGARQTLFDVAVEQYLPALTQFVILGAGFDTRAYRLPREGRVRSFEVDAPKTQAVKRELLKKAGIDSTVVTFVSADFEQENWLTRLIEAGFDPGQPALFLLEGVLVYLDREAAEDTFRKITSTAQGTVLAFDYFTTVPLESNGLYWRYGRAATKAAGEPMKFGIDSTPPSRERVAELLASCGLTLIENQTLGQEAVAPQRAADQSPAASKTQKRAWGGFAVATVK